MKKLLITGAIASGKSTVARMLSDLGAVVVDADAIVHSLMLPGTDITSDIKARFGESVIKADGSVDRAALGHIAFSDEAALRYLESITHPAVVQTVRQLMAEAESQDAQCFAAEVQLLAKSGLASEGDAVLVVECPEHLRLQRLKEKGLTTEDAISRMGLGPQPDELRELGDFVVLNNGDEAELRESVERFYGHLVSP